MTKKELTNLIKKISLEDVSNELASLCSADIPTDTVVYLGTKIISEKAKKFNLPSPQLIGGNLVIGNLSEAKYILTAHLDEISFGIKSIDDGKIIIVPYHNFGAPHAPKIKEVNIIGVRNNKVQKIAEGIIDGNEENILLKTKAPVKVGDRVVYRFSPVIEKDWLAAKALDDRVGVLAVLLAASLLKRLGISATVVLSDGEECRPDGYFSRNFPFALRKAPNNCLVAFVDGVFKADLVKSGVKSLPTNSFVSPHASEGKGLIVNPILFAYLRDTIIPYCSKEGFPAEVATSYRSRGDEWGMLLDPSHNANKYGFIADSACWEEKVNDKLIQIASPKSIINLAFLLCTVGQRLPNILNLIDPC